MSAPYALTPLPSSLSAALYPNALQDEDFSTEPIRDDNSDLTPLNYSLFPWLLRPTDYRFNRKPTRLNNITSATCKH